RVCLMLCGPSDKLGQTADKNGKVGRLAEQAHKHAGIERVRLHDEHPSCCRTRLLEPLIDGSPSHRASDPALSQSMWLHRFVGPPARQRRSNTAPSSDAMSAECEGPYPVRPF